MLSRLFIQNYAIIDELEIDFSQNLNVLTGETGAGKSIIIGALGLILGSRADSNVLLAKDRKCIIEGSFSSEGNNEAVALFLKENELDAQDEVVVRREIALTGKSRAFINDTPVNLWQLQQLSTMLVDLHQQFDTLDLGEADFQRAVLDALAGNATVLKKYKDGFYQLQKTKQQLEELQEQKNQFTKEYDYHQFQFNELDEAAFKQDELEQLEQELQMQTNAEGIKTALERINYELQQGEQPVTKQLRALGNQLQQYASLHADLPVLADRLQSAYIELQDIADEAERISEHISADAATVEQISERVSLGYKLLKKHGVKTTNELLAIKDALEQKLQQVLNIDKEIAVLEKEHQNLLSKSEGEAEKISSARQKQIKPLEQQVNEMLKQVGMPNASIKVDMQKRSLTANGGDDVEFLFDANKKGSFQPIRKVASGGELSRLMLCIKSLVAQSMDMPTLIFDEIDSGISGEAAKQVGVIMKDLAKNRQVICITHQPQIAGKADAHYMVYKAIKGSAVTTGVKILNKDERIVAIAKMMSGEQPTAAALENAREMVMN